MKSALALRSLLFTAALAGSCLTATANAESWPVPRPRVFSSAWGWYGFKVMPNGATGLLYSLDEGGAEQIVWNKGLVNLPHQVFVEDEGEYVVTIDSYGDLGREHALVVYDGTGEVLADYRLEELLSEPEIRDEVIHGAPSRDWAFESTPGFAFRRDDHGHKYFDITLDWGRVLTVELSSGAVTKGDTGDVEPGDEVQLPDARNPSLEPPRFTLQAAAMETFGDQQFLSLTIEVSNPNDVSLLYTGYAPDSFDPPLEEGAPLCQTELMRADGEWEPYHRGFCATGLTALELEPKSSVRIGVSIPAGDWQAASVGIVHNAAWSGGASTTTTHWSTLVTREEIEELQ